MDGESSKSVMITAVAEPKEISVSGAGACEVTLLLVGSGGYSRSGCAGAGSGHLVYSALQLSAGTVLRAVVGQGSGYADHVHEGNTSVLFSTPVTIDGITVEGIMAQPAEVAGFNNGGSGYSGGGGAGYCESPNPQFAGEGGSDGSDGRDGYRGQGGEGTGEDISNYVFASWTLTPGVGGKTASSRFGGGGGGILVDGAGPQPINTVGQGYGGGASGYGGDPDRFGVPGLILMEIN